MKILILRFSSLGDILLATPVLSALKQRYPDCIIEWVVKDNFQQALSTTLINKIHTFHDNKSFNDLVNELKHNSYDLVFDLHRNFKSWLIRRCFKNVFCYEKRELKRFFLVWLKKRYSTLPVPVMYFQALIKAGINIPSKWDLLFEINLNNEIAVMKKIALADQNFLAFAPGASYFTKRWPQNYFAQLAELLNDEFSLVLLGNGTTDDAICSSIASVSPKIINLSSRLLFSETAVVLKNCKMLISNDSGILHLAECFKTPVVAFFGSTTEELGFFPYSTSFKVLENKDLKCRPCSHFGRKKCPRKHFDCMHSIKPEIAYKEVKKLLKTIYNV